MASEIRRLHPLSWIFITAISVKGLLFPLILVMFASGANPLARYELLGMILVIPAFVAALLKQGIYSYRFTEEELVIRDGILIKKVRHIPYDRVHNIALVQNPFHRMLGVASARVETAAGGEPEAVMRVLTLAAVDELHRYALGSGRAVGDSKTVADESVVAPVAPVATSDASVGTIASSDASTSLAAGTATVTPTVVLRLPPSEFVRLGLISNRGLVVVAAFFGLISQAQWWEQDWEAYYETARETAPAWTSWLLDPASLTARISIGVGLVLLFLVLLRLFSVAWYLVKYYGFTLQRDDEGLRTEFGLLTRVSSLIPVHRIQLLTTSASLLHRWFGRTAIDVETAGASEGGSDLGTQLAGSGLKANRQWLAPIIDPDEAVSLIRTLMPEVDLDAVEWSPLDPRAARRLLKKAALVLAPPTGGVMILLHFTPIPLSALHGLWLPAIALPVIYLGVTGWVRNAAYALTDEAVFFRSGWLGRKTSVVRFDKMQTVKMSESPFDRRHRMASVAVDTAGAGKIGHRIDIPYLDADVARRIFVRLYAETRAREFRW